MAEAGLDSRGWTPRWIPLGPVDSFRGPAEATPGREQAFVLLTVFGEPVDSGFQVASQKIAAVASELARLALPHTFPARRDPYNEWVSG